MISDQRIRSLRGVASCFLVSKEVLQPLAAWIETLELWLFKCQGV